MKPLVFRIPLTLWRILWITWEFLQPVALSPLQWHVAHCFYTVKDLHCICLHHLYFLISKFYYFNYILDDPNSKIFLDTLVTALNKFLCITIFFPFCTKKLRNLMQDWEACWVVKNVGWSFSIGGSISRPHIAIKISISSGMVPVFLRHGHYEYKWYTDIN